jgi:mRNA (guanine-N7-)-methyltransferase
MNKHWQKQRQQSYFYQMRKFHNSIKRELYDKYAYGKSVLELAIGRFGDGQKLFDDKVKRVVGYDIDASSITEARRRLMEYPQDFQSKVVLGVKDLSTEVISGNKEFDVVSCMFALHYFFKTEETFETILKSIENNLRISGIFMATLFDGKKIMKRLEEPFEDPQHFLLHQKTKTDSLFGNTINVLLKDGDLHSSSANYNPDDENIVDSERFIATMEMLGFQLIESKFFSEYDSSKFRLSKTEKDVSFLNRTFVFKRIFDIDEELKCVHRSQN